MGPFQDRGIQFLSPRHPFHRFEGVDDLMGRGHHLIMARLPYFRDAGDQIRHPYPSETAFFDGYVVQNRKALDAMRKIAPALEWTDHAFQERILQNYEFSFNVDQLPPSFEKPVLIVVGKQDSVVGYSDAWKMLSQFPRATFAVLDKAGHFLGSEQDELLRALATEWLQRVEEYPS